MQRPVFPSRQEYGRQFTDAAFWRPYVEEVCRRHGLAPCEQIGVGLPGTHPVFLVEDRWVVKFFGDLFGGEEAFAIERDIFALVAGTQALDVPRMHAEGRLFNTGDAWRWPYLVSALLPGQQLVAVSDQVPEADRAALAGYAARQLRALHSTPLGDTGALRRDWAPFAGWIASQCAACAGRHRDAQILPAHLVAQIPTYLPPVSELLDAASPPRLLHCDLNADHMLVELRDGRWAPTGIIDFGDAKVGDVLYELVALHIGMFRYDTRLLAHFLRAYGVDDGMRRDFVRRAMSYTLLHEFDVLHGLFEHLPELRDAPTLDVLAQRIWGIGEIS